VTCSPVSRPTTPSGAQPVVGGHQSVLQSQQPTANKSAALPLAIAAILLLALGGGAYAMRNQIPLLQQFMGSPQNAANTTAPSASLGASNSVASAVPAATQPVVTPPPVPAAPAAPEPATVATASVPTAPATAAPQDPRYANESANAATAALASVPSATATQEPAGPAARASEVQPLKELAAAQAAETVPARRTLAKATEPEAISAPRRPHVPTIAVVAGGDEVITEPAERAIEAALAKHGYHMIDQDTMPRVAHLLSGGKPNAAAVLAALNGRADAVIVVHARPAGSEQINYYGQSSTLNTAQLNVTAYAVEGQRKLAAGSEQVHFTSLNASDQAEEAVEGMLPELEQQLTQFLPSRHRE